MSDPKILCEMTCGRAGSKFFHSLLDWHPQIMSFPRPLCFNTFWKNLGGNKGDLRYVVDSFIKQNPRYFSGEIWERYGRSDRANQLGAEKSETFYVDSELFRRKALEELGDKELTRAAVFLGVHRAYHLACGRDIQELFAIHYHIHFIDGMEELGAILSDFPGHVRLIIPIRHPVQQIKSIVAWRNLQNTLNCGEIFHYQRQLIRGATHITRQFPQLDVRVLPFEKLQRCQREVMEDIARWLGVSWNDSLLVSTMQGKLWWGNANKMHNKADSKWKVYKPMGKLENKDWEVFCSLAHNRMRKYGYIKGNEMEPVGKIRFFMLSLLPTAAEWTLLRYMVSLRHWREVLKNIKWNIDDPELQGFDFFTKKEIRTDKKGTSTFNERMIRFWRITKQLIKHISVFNPAKWLYFYIKRVVYCNKFFANRMAHESRLPGVILEEVGIDGQPVLMEINK